ncbi:hypothetical protein dqs_0285 [Azoarcus olearius]|uniref:hypothetical protein n=1 Tax=Azoarcus sp. (strain BH72) TaxID=418699 RepID=UPI000806205C|nr:hypothetical protein [Azoarcus olearius]ANQ83362.1 hypothetical protein dqs_0285 [Azoarcus olearius]
MNTPSPADPLRKRLRALPPPAAGTSLRARLLADADARLPHPAAWWQPLWRTGLAAMAVVAVCAFGVNEYLAWQEIQELAELDTLSTATMLLL